MTIRPIRNAAVTLTEMMILVAIIALLGMIGSFHYVKAREIAQRNICIANLELIQNAKEAWAVEQRKGASDVPTDADLFGPGKYIARKPQCPDGGSYCLGAVCTDPTCGFALTKGHVLHHNRGRDSNNNPGQGVGPGHGQGKGQLSFILIAP